MFNWTPDADTLLAQRAAQGLTAAQIGAMLGVTKNAIIGRARRIGVALNPPRGAAPGGVTILDLTAQTCRFPLGDPRDFNRFRYCGAPVRSACVYCDDHHARCHRAEYRQERREMALLGKALRS
jgi:GcrA cell cycle regulator